MAIEHPNYYTDKKIEVIDYIKDTLTEDEYIGFCIGNVMKYISRWQKKVVKQTWEKPTII